MRHAQNDAHPIIEVDDLCKVYRGEGRGVLVQEILCRMLRTERTCQENWALRNVSFSIARGESLGIVGGNGAGKSTLIKILAGITTRTSGALQVNGAIASQLAVGAGLHPYLSGRENIFLLGTMLGVSNAKMRTLLSRVIDFAGLEAAIDRPLWTFSSGMTARLGVAVAMHADFDVLLLDEALNSGDREFRERCTATLLEIRASGASLVIVSHGAEDLSKLCDRVLWLDRGIVRALGPAPRVLGLYENWDGSGSKTARIRTAPNR